MSEDKTAVSISLPDAQAEGIIANVTITHPWSGNGDQLDAKVYVSNGRIAGLEAGDAKIHAYGVSGSDGITVRKLASGSAARFVSTAWLVGNRIARGTLLVQAMEALSRSTPGWDGIDLSMDDGPILGAHGDGIARLIAATIDADSWQCAVTGAMSLPGWREMTLRPTVVERRPQGAATVYRFFEGSSSVGQPDVTFTWQPGAAGEAAAYTFALADLALSPVLDNVADGSWERPEHLWVRTRDGWLKLPHAPATPALPYSISAESRVCDIGRAIAPALAGLQGKLLLDRSGAKVLEAVVQDGQLLSLTLRVAEPALALQLVGIALDGSELASPAAPPAQGASSKLGTLHLVPEPLGGDPATPWRLMVDGPNGRLACAWQAGAADTAPVYYGRHENWVLPPEAAANEDPGVAPARTLIALHSRAAAISCRLGDGGIGAVDGFDTIADHAFAHGPLARFGLALDASHLDAALCEEYWAGALPVAASRGEPAVLRPLYRMLPAKLAETEGVAPYESTLVAAVRAEVAPDRPLPVAAGTALARRTRTASPVPRWEVFRPGPAGEFGWDDSSRFLSFQAVNGDAPVVQPPWEWLEHGAADGNRLWLRLSDGSLLDRPLPAGTIEELSEKLKSGSEDTASTRRPLNLLEAYHAQQQTGLAKLALHETVSADRSEFHLALALGQDGIALTGPGATVLASASRIVAAWAGRQDVETSLGNGIMTSRLTRVFLEMEREAGSARVIRALIGWEVRQAFGLAASAMQVTEIYDREDAVLVRKLEFNGLMKSEAKSLGPQCELTIYCWDALLRPDTAQETTLPVICNYLFRKGDKKTQICALQDAHVRGDYLDLSADVAFFGTERDGVDGAATHPWEPDRRGLFSFKVSLHPDSYNLKGFIKVRMRAKPQLAELIANPGSMRLVPAWSLCDSEIVPRFTSMRNAERANPAWCSKGLLRSASGAPGARHLQVQVFHGEEFFLSDLNYGSTLIGESGVDTPVLAGLPSWVPSPIRDPRDLQPGALERARFRLWIFNPHAFAVDSWPGEPLAAAAPADEAGAIQAQSAAAIKQARGTLWRVGWTREAVLERQPASGETIATTSWTVIDSPLQNRSASIAWMGWPMAGGDRHPVDELPLTAQIAQRDPNEADSFAVQVAFRDDAGQGGMAPAWPVLLRPGQGAVPLPERAPLGMLSFASRGVRVGAEHRVLQYGEQIRAIRMEPPQLRHADGGHFSIEFAEDDAMALGWDTATVAQGDVILQRDERKLTLTLAAGIMEVRVQGLPDRTVLSDGTALRGQKLTVERTPADAALPGTVTLFVPDGPLPHFTVEREQNQAWTELLVFPGVSTRLAGVFGDGQTLLAFGEETLAYRQDQAGLWTRSRSAILRLPPNQAVEAVMTIDLDGLVTTYRPVP